MVSGARRQAAPPGPSVQEGRVLHALRRTPPTHPLTHVCHAQRQRRRCTDRGRLGQESHPHTHTHSHHTHIKAQRKRPDTGGHLDGALVRTPRTETKADTHTDVDTDGPQRDQDRKPTHPRAKARHRRPATWTHAVTNTETHSESARESQRNSHSLSVSLSLTHTHTEPQASPSPAQPSRIHTGSRVLTPLPWARTTRLLRPASRSNSLR